MADIHEIVLKQGNKDKATLTFKVPHFTTGDQGDDWDMRLEDGDIMSISATAKTQTGDAISDIMFSWSSKDAAVVTANDGMVEGISNGTTDVMVDLVGRGIQVKFSLTVLAEVKHIVINSPESGHYITVGEDVALDATAYDSKEDLDQDNIVDTDLLYFTSSNTSVVMIDGMKANGVGVGSAKITAHVGDVKSDAITINVSPGGLVTHVLTHTRKPASDRKITRTQTGGADTPGTDDDTYTYAPSGGIVFAVQVREIAADGTTPIDTGVSSGVSVKVQPSGTDVIDVTEVSISVTAGVAEITIPGTAAAIQGIGTARLIVSYLDTPHSADDLALTEFTIVNAP